MKIFTFIAIVCHTTLIFSQERYTKEFSFINDNDLYISTRQDRYYTNGIFLTYRYLGKNSSIKTEKKILEIKLGQKIYTPFKGIVRSIKLHDRPFAGYLFGSFGANFFYKKNTILKLSTEIGTIGTYSFGEEMMKFMHDIYGFKDAVGWKYQISNTFVLNFRGAYIKKIITNESKKIDIHWHNKIRLGTAFTDLSTGFYGRLGLIKLQKLANSIAFNSNLNNKSSNYNTEKEVFFYINPTVSYIAYDATIQGNLFNNNSPVTFGIFPFRFATEFGIRFNINKFNFGYSVFYHTKKLKSIKVPKQNFYGSIQLNYLFN